MRFVIQSVESAQIFCFDVGTQELLLDESIKKGIVVYVGIENEDLHLFREKIEIFVKKINSAKLLKSPDNTISSSLKDVLGEILLVSNFTLYGDNTKGTKMNFSRSAKFQDAKNIYDYLVQKLGNENSLKSAVFGLMMKITLEQYGPINYVWDL